MCWNPPASLCLKHSFCVRGKHLVLCEYGEDVAKYYNVLLGLLNLIKLHVYSFCPYKILKRIRISVSIYS